MVFAPGIYSLKGFGHDFRWQTVGFENINRLPERFGVGHWQLFREILQIDGLGNGTFGLFFCRSPQAMRSGQRDWKIWRLPTRGLWFGWLYRNTTLRDWKIWFFQPSWLVYGLVWLFFGDEIYTTQLCGDYNYPLGEGIVHIPPNGIKESHRLISVPSGKWSFPGGVDHKLRRDTVLTQIFEA